MRKMLINAPRRLFCPNEPGAATPRLALLVKSGYKLQKLNKLGWIWGGCYRSLAAPIAKMKLIERDPKKSRRLMTPAFSKSPERERL